MSLYTESQTKRLLSQAMLQSNATCLEYTDIQSDVSLALWRNQEDRVLTHNKHIHTLSMYIEGGDCTYRTDQKDRVGSPNKLCFFPAGHTSDWVVGQPLKLVHLYFTDTHLNYLSLTAFDKDPRTFEIPDLTFETDRVLTQGLHHLIQRLNASDMSNRLQLQEIQQQLILHLLSNYSQYSTTTIKGGLSPSVQARVIEYMNTYIDQDISLVQLATIACQSTYHFAHMFKQSVGLSPYQFLLKQRMNLAATQLQQSTCIADVGERCGYHHPSRFARAFKAAFGMTPTAYQRAIA